jgi:hypothetical protein
MDPTANLEEQLSLSREIIFGNLTPRQREEKSDRLAELVDALHEWISHGGFLPKQWANR